MVRSIIRQIERNLTASVGSNPDQLIRPRSAESIKASGHVTAPKGRTHDCKRPTAHHKKTLASRGPSTHEAALHAHVIVGVAVRLSAHHNPTIAAQAGSSCAKLRSKPLSRAEGLQFGFKRQSRWVVGVLYALKVKEKSRHPNQATWANVVSFAGSSQLMRRWHGP